jgi:DNA-binding FadR family transcriptional regulator
MKRLAEIHKEPVATPIPAPSPISLVRRVSGGPGVSLLNLAVDSLRRAVLAAGPDEFLGSEEQLIEALGVSRPTFRQATKLLRHENLLRIKRGVSGGFFTQAPSALAVTQMAAIYLNAQRTSMRQVNDVLAPLQAASARQLASNPDPTVRACLSDFLADYSNLPVSQQNPVLRALKFERLLGEKTGNPAIALVMDVMRDLVRDTGRVHFLLKPERMTDYYTYQARLAQAILDGDSEMATLICQRHNAQFRSWLPDEQLKDYTPSA